MKIFCTGFKLKLDLNIMRPKHRFLFQKIECRTKKNNLLIEVQFAKKLFFEFLNLPLLS